MTPLLSLTQETGTRLDGIERSTYETRDSIKRDSVQKFAKMKDQIAEVTKKIVELEKKVDDENKRQEQLNKERFA